MTNPDMMDLDGSERRAFISGARRGLLVGLIWAALAAAAFVIGTKHAHASPSPAQLGLDKSSTTGNLSVMDVSGAWVELGVVNGTAHTFQIPTSSLSVQTVTVGGVTCTLGGSCAPTTTINSTACVLGSSCSLPALTIAVGSQPTSGGAAGQIMFDTGSTLTESPLLVFTSPVLKVLSNTAELSMGTGADVDLFRDGAGILSQRNGSNAQLFAVYDAFTNATNYERGVFDWQLASGVLSIGTEGGSVVSPTDGRLQFIVGGANKLDYGVTSAGAWSFGTTILAPSITTSGAVVGASVSSGGPINAGGAIDAIGGLVISGVGFFGPNSTLTAAPPSVATAQVGYGGTVTGTTSCGSLAGAAGCLTINVAGTVRHVPFY